MKLLVIADLHGRLLWKDIIEKENPDKIIFLGDYVTSHEGISPEQQLDNLEEILAYKENNFNKVVLLRGNHCMQMLGYSWVDCNPREPEVQKVMSTESFRNRFLGLTKWIYVYEPLACIFSHAGISQVWLHNSNIHNIYSINSLPPSELFGFTPDNIWDSYGDSVTQPPTWIRPEALMNSCIQGWNQVVGHTPVKQIFSKDTKDNKKIWFCDALGIKQYLVIDNNEFQPKTFEQ